MDPDLELLEQWRNGDSDAGGRLLAQYFNSLRVYFVQRVSEADPEDLIQEVFRRMVEARDRFEGRSRLRTYLFHIAQNVYYETVRKLHRPNGSFDPLTESIASVSGRSQSSLLAEDERQQLLLAALRSLTATEQDIIELRHFHGLSSAELAEHFGIPQGTAKSRLAVARRQLGRAFLEAFKAGGELSDESIARDLDQVREVVWRGRAGAPA
ncbi:ECF RNA polymerase sigma-E factor [Enhygromyxa salina]|uniref:ECF RNA polymerase sigma-E factor n=1 Tax=Enhygromyxa salina TaxID=215803 RepID=A0A2S9YD58_9BACT|nr:sigma-70 family RNA polymerase sigma factor [Enhygromyxa salina]PRQ02956.1 ECF RNA polymerase sigma-E factor [Enhygromyxa salina]